MFRKSRTYLDVAAGATGNPSSPHAEGRAARARIEAARKAIAELVEAKPEDVVFTSGATESNAIAILGIAKHALQMGVGKPHMLYLPTSHASIVENMRAAEELGVEIEPLSIKNAAVDIDALRQLLRPETVLVSMDAVCGETGVVWNTREVASAVRSAAVAGKGSAQAARPIQHPLPATAVPLMHVDASQAARTEKMLRAHFGADILTFDASKVCSARGIGALVVPYAVPLAPLYRGGGQERGLRAGSEAPELAEAFARGLASASRARETFVENARVLRASLATFITSLIPRAYIQEGRVQAPHIVSVSLPGRDTDYLVALLDEAGFAVSTRSACETDSEIGSRAVLTLTGDIERARSTLRISWGPETTARDLRRFGDALVTNVRFIDTGTDR